MNNDYRWLWLVSGTILAIVACVVVRSLVLEGSVSTGLPTLVATGVGVLLGAVPFVRRHRPKTTTVRPQPESGAADAAMPATSASMPAAEPRS